MYTTMPDEYSEPCQITKKNFLENNSWLKEGL